MTSRGELKGAARRELARRELARRQFLDFCGAVYHGYPVGARHLQLLAKYLEQVERYVATRGTEGIGRLMVNMPPRNWKSTTTSVIFPTWVLGRNPDCRIIVTSYNGSLAFGFSRRARNTMQDIPFRNVFGDRAAQPDAVQISDDSRSTESWDLAGHRGGMAAAGVGGGITGKGANLFIVDDPHKDRADAESELSRAAVWDWYTSTAYTRLEPGGAVIVIQTRWHAEDLSGKLLRQMATDAKADQWTVLSMPAIAEEPVEEPEKRIEALKKGFWLGADPLQRAPGDALWPEEYPAEALEQKRVNVGGYDWDALYQQHPQKRDGAMIQAHKIKKVRENQLPDGLSWVRYWDLAVSERARADWIAGGRVGFARDGRLYIGHMSRLPGPWVNARGEMKKVMLQDGAAVRQGIEVAGQQGGYYQEFKIDPELIGVAIEPVNPKQVGNKEVRAQVWASRIQDGLVYLVDDGTWDVDAFISECLAFPTGSHDDQVDAVSGAVQMLGGWAGSLADVPQDDGTVSPWAILPGEGIGGDVVEWDVMRTA